MHDSRLEEIISDEIRTAEVPMSDRLAVALEGVTRASTQLNELWAAAKIVSDLTPDCSTTEWNVALLNLHKVVCKTGIA